MSFIRNRLLLMLYDKEAFHFTVSSATNNPSFFDYSNPLAIFGGRDALNSMIYSDLKKSPEFRNIPILNEELTDLERMIDNDSFGKNRDSFITEGEKNHAKVLAFLHKKVYDNNDIDF